MGALNELDHWLAQTISCGVRVKEIVLSDNDYATLLLETGTDRPKAGSVICYYGIPVRTKSERALLRFMLGPMYTELWRP